MGLQSIWLSRCDRRCILWAGEGKTGVWLLLNLYNLHHILTKPKMPLCSPASGSGSGWSLVLQKARTWCEGSRSHPESSECLAQVGGEMEGRWKMGTEIYSMYSGSKRCHFFFFFPSECWESAWLMAWELPGRLWRVLEYWSFGLRHLSSVVKGLTESIPLLNLLWPPLLHPTAGKTRKTRPACGTHTSIPDPMQARRIRFSLLLLPAFPKSDLDSCSQRDPKETPKSKIFNLKDACPLLRAWQFYADWTLTPAVDRSGPFFNLHPYWLRFCWTLYLVVCIMTTIKKSISEYKIKLQ